MLSTAPAGDGGPVGRRGTYAGGSYLIEVPTGWNGGLVIFAHGYGEASASPLASHLAANRYAWAAPSYRRGGYRPDCFLEDTLQLRDHVAITAPACVALVQVQRAPGLRTCVKRFG